MLVTRIGCQQPGYFGRHPDDDEDVRRHHVDPERPPFHFAPARLGARRSPRPIPATRPVTRVCPRAPRRDAHKNGYHHDLDHCTRRPRMLRQEVWGLEPNRVSGSPKTMNVPEFGEFSLSVATDTSPASNDQ
jgi:hypothetical protein